MRRMMALFVITPIVALFVLAGCKSASQDDDSAMHEPGRFSVQRAQDDASRNVSLGSVSVSSSESVFFILRNVGDFPITEVTMSVSTVPATSEASFVVSPSSISSINPESTSSIVNLVRIDINHGLIAGKVGQSNYIDPAVKEAVVAIRGKTTDSLGNVIEVSENCSLSTLIWLADFTFEYTSDGGATWTEIPIEQNILGLGFNGFHGPAGASSDTRIRNTGNVDIKIQQFITFSGNISDTIAWDTLAPGASMAFGNSVYSTATFKNQLFVIDTLGTVYDNTVTGLKFMTDSSILWRGNSAAGVYWY